MSVFPRISLRPEVYEHLRHVFLNQELQAAVGRVEAERRFQGLLLVLSHPPGFTCVRASTHLAPLEEVRRRLAHELEEQQQRCGSPDAVTTEILLHPLVPDVLLLPVIGPRSLVPLRSEVVVGAQCGSAVLRGAHVFAPGIVATPKFMKPGDAVSVFSDVDGRCTRGCTKPFQGNKVFVGNGVSEMHRATIFAQEPTKGMGVRMTEPLYQSPSFDGVLPDLVFLQNLPSVVVGHVLGPRPGERVLDMCAAPGGKTCHMAGLMKNQGEVLALDRIRNKVELIRQNAAALRLTCVRAFCFNSTRAVASGPALLATDGPPFPPSSFDRVLLDAPCSGLGQRPSMTVGWSLKEITSYSPLQRKLLHAGEVLALDRIRNKVELIRQNAAALRLTCVRAFCFNSTRAVASGPALLATDGPPFPPSSFDRVLLDAPCSGLGQRPSMTVGWSLKEITSYSPLQRKLLHAAVQLLRPGGVLVYSTCTVTLAENEEQVAWALHTYPCLSLVPQEPHVGGPGLPGAGLTPDQLKVLQRFSPELSIVAPPLSNEAPPLSNEAPPLSNEAPPLSNEAPPLSNEAPPLSHRADRDTIGFFIAKFLKS